jgi:hypothetical protein
MQIQNTRMHLETAHYSMDCTFTISFLSRALIPNQHLKSFKLPKPKEGFQYETKKKMSKRKAEFKMGTSALRKISQKKG